MQQIIKETKIKYIYYTSNLPLPTYEKLTSKELLMTNNLIINNPTEFHNSALIITKENLQFEILTENSNYIDIVSDDSFFIKISDALILKTKSFNYLNIDTPISVSIANGYHILQLDGDLIISPESRDIRIEYVTASGI